jgi:hypothetical protein
MTSRHEVRMPEDLNADRTTVVLATILFLLVLSQRFRIRRVRFGALVVAIGLMMYGLITILTLPRF